VVPVATELATAYISLIPSFRGGTGKIERELGGVGDKAGRKAGSGFSAAFRKTALIAAPVAAGAVVLKQMGDVFAAAAESRKIAALTEQVIRSTGGSAKVTADQVGDLAESLAAKTGVDDELIQSGANVLLTFKNIRDEAGAGNDVFSQTTALANDMSVAMGTDMTSASKQLGKALNNPLKGMSALAKIGVDFSDSQKEQIKGYIASGDLLSAQKIILAEVGTKFGGAAEAAATPLDKLKVTVGNLQEKVGGFLLPVIDKAATAIGQHLPAGIAVARDLFEKIRPTLDTITAQLAAVDWATVFADAKAFLEPIVASFVDLAAAVGQFAVQHWPKVAALFPVIKDVAEFLGPVLATAVGFLADHMDVLGPALVAVAAGFVAIKAGEAGARVWDSVNAGATGAADKIRHLNTNYDKLLKNMKSGATEHADRVKKAFTAIGEKASAAGKALSSAGKRAIELGQSMLKSAAAVVKSTAAWIANKAAMIAGKIAMAATTIATGIATAATAAFNFVMALNPVVLVVIAIVALIAALVLAYHKVDWFRAFVDKAFTAVKDVALFVFDAVRQAVVNVFSFIVDFVTLYVSTYVKVVTFAFQTVRTVIETVLGVVASVVSTVFSGIQTVIGNAVDGAKLIVEVGFAILKALLIDPIVEAKDKASEILDGLTSLFSELPGKLADGLSSLADKIAAPFKAMAQAIRDAWNDTIGGKGFTIPDIPGVPGGGTEFRIPTLHTGGPVTGRSGQEVLRILEAGEWVLSRDEVARIKAAGRSPADGPIGAAGFRVDRLEVTTVANATADEVVQAINAKLGWAHTTRRDR
jgi:phage-related protein